MTLFRTNNAQLRCEIQLASRHFSANRLFRAFPKLKSCGESQSSQGPGCLAMNI
jgi:hypothetical protein